MNNNDISMLQILDNNPLLKVDRAISEIRRGMPVLIESGVSPVFGCFPSSH